MENIKFKENFDNYRVSIYKPETRQFLLSKIAGSTQEADMSVPSKMMDTSIAITIRRDRHICFLCTPCNF